MNFSLSSWRNTSIFPLHKMKFGGCRWPTVRCHYKTVQFITILHIALLKTVADSVSDFRITTDTSYLASRASYGVSFVKILEKINRVITAPHCIYTRCQGITSTMIIIRVGGCERVFTPVRWRQVRLSCIKWRSTFFLYFFVRPSFGRQFVISVDGCCANCVVGLAFLPSGHTTRKQRHYDAITTSCARWVG